jgi:uncharacterized protein YcfJ
MRGFKAGLCTLAAAGLMGVATPQDAQAHHYHHYYRCAANRHNHAVAGTIIGAVAGGVIGNAIGHGRPVGTLLGAGVGAFAGHQIGRSTHPC